MVEVTVCTVEGMKRVIFFNGEVSCCMKHVYFLKTLLISCIASSVE